MTHNKGKKLRFCEECKRKRFCYIESLGNARYRHTCSKNHIWVPLPSRTDEVIAIEIERLLPKIKDLFERDDIFYKHLKSK